MNNNDMIKAPTTPYGDKTEKIEYAMYMKSSGETLTLFFFIGFLIIPNLWMLITIFLLRDRMTISEDFFDPLQILASYAPTIAIAAVLIGFHIHFRKKRLAKLAKIQAVIDKGQMVIGDIMNLETITTGSGDDRTTHYYYHVRYKKPGSDDEVQFDTPYLTGHPQIRSDEFPLKVKVYIGEGSYSYADEIINAPSEKIKTRKRTRAILVIGTVVLAVGGIFMMPFNMLIGVIMFGSGMVCALLANFQDNK